MGAELDTSQATATIEAVRAKLGELHVAPTPRVWLAQPTDDGVIPLVVLHGCDDAFVDDIATHCVEQGGEVFRRALVFPSDVDVRWLGDALTETATLASDHLRELAELANVEVRSL